MTARSAFPYQEIARSLCAQIDRRAVFFSFRAMESTPTATAGRFALPSLAWVAAGVCAGAPLLGLAQQATDGRLTLHATATALLMAFLLMLLPIAAAWFIWQFGGHRPALRNGAFFVTLGVVATVLFTHAARQNQERTLAAQDQARALASQLVQREADGAVAPTKRDSSAGAADPSSTAQPIIAAQRAVKARLDAIQIAYDDAAAAVIPDKFFDLATLTSPAALAARRTAAETFAKANKAVGESASLGAFYLSIELRDRGVAEDAVREAVSVYRSATKKHLPRLKQLRDNDGARALLMAEFVAWAEKNFGQWRADSAGGAVRFKSADAESRYQDLLRTSRVLETERDRLRQELIGAKR